MKIIPTDISDVVIIEPKVFGDDRGYFFESFRLDKLRENGVDLDLQALLIFSAVIGMSGSFISLAMSKWSAKHMTGAQVITQAQNKTQQWLLATVERQASQAGIKMPEVAIYQSPDVNAFATGMSRNNSLVAVSTGLIESMKMDEAEAVLAHEVSHVANGDMVTLALIQGVVNTFVIFASRVVGHIVDRVILKNERGHGIGFFFNGYRTLFVMPLGSHSHGKISHSGLDKARINSRRIIRSE